jgi:hypothetical protein
VSKAGHFFSINFWVNFGVNFRVNLYVNFWIDTNDQWICRAGRRIDLSGALNLRSGVFSWFV